MAAIEQLAEGVSTVDELLAEPLLEPDPEREDWAQARPRVVFVRDAVERDVLSQLDDALFAADDELAPRIKGRVAVLLGDVAGLKAASGDLDGARRLLGKAAPLAQTPEARAELEAAAEELPVFARLTHARWLQRAGHFKRADRALAQARRQVKSRALRDALREVEKAPRPLERAPTLFTLNGIGFRLYGERDPWPDGSYVATYCFCVVFIPIVPVAAYRVRQVSTMSYQFLAKEPLGPIAKVWRGVALLGTLGVVASVAVTSYLDSPTRKASVALAEAREAEAKGDPEGALSQYRLVLGTYPGEVDVDEVAASIVRLVTAEDVHEPATVASLEAISRVMNAFYELPADARDGKAAVLLAERLSAFADQIGEDTPEKAAAALTVLDMAARVSEGRAEAAAITARRARLRKNLADGMAESRPLGALRHYVALGDAASIEAAKKILDSFGPAPSLWIEAETEVEAWAELASKQGQADGAADVRARLEEARKKLAEDRAILEANDEVALVVAIVQRKGHQELAVGMAAGQRSRGETKSALKLLGGLGAPGRLTALAQQALADTHAEAGALDKADEILTALVNERLSDFQEAQRAFRAASLKVQGRIEADLRAGKVPSELLSKLQGATEARERELIQAYVAEQFRKDPTLASMQDTLLRHEAVIPASISLGMIKLRRASTTTGDTQRALLEQAERAFLALRGEAAGDPLYHLGLGQVYHRLGRAADGDAELEGLLQKKDPTLSIRVANAYRELGLEPKARQVVEAVYNDTSVEQDKRYVAASLRANISTSFEDRAKWLGLADPNSPYVKAQLLQVKGARAVSQGNLAEADRAFAEEAAFHEKDAARDASSANNAAIAHAGRYQATGDVAHLRAAVKGLETAVRLEGDSAILLGHLADALDQLAILSVLDRWVDTRALRLDASDAWQLARAMLEGPLRAEILAALEKDANERRALSVSRTEQVLAPQKASAYRRELDWLSLRGDGKGLGELSARLQALPPFDAQNTAAARATWLAEEQDAELANATKREAEVWRSRIQELEKSRKAPTAAAAWFTLGDLLWLRTMVDSSVENVDEMAKAYRRAHELWPEGIPARSFSAGLAAVAIGKARAASPALAKAWETERRQFSTLLIAHRASLGPDAAEVLAALRKQPEFAEAATLRRGKLDGRPELADWILARLAGDAELEKEAENVFDWDVARHRVEIDARMYPGQPQEQLELGLVRSRGKTP
ncbi:hypothetical protein [Polyangium sorediatum]|uniref:Tetratricopeptide repeat protein n=1 Tax=Polyangium sorediatum TaxID=889274 RepID=A0ABT6NLD9_9BACT|nr:hypothetical protein [Polyangium sorediatum]MDI1429132.1 hypothetical protein [Polyangium sorediatum]